MVFSAFQLLYMTLAVDNIDGRDLSNTAQCECLPRILKKKHQTVARKWSALVIKGSGKRCSDAFKRRLGFSLNA